MSNTIRLVAFAVSWAACSGLGLPAAGQEPVEPEPAVPVAPAEPAPLEQKEAETEKGWPLYLSAAIGSADGEDLNTSIVTRQSIDQTLSTFSLPEQQHGRAAIGWKLPRDKGDFRLAYNGYKEDTYELDSSGQSVKLFETPGSSLGTSAVDFVEWWHVSVENGHWVASRTPQLWDGDVDDANQNGAADLAEVRVGAVDRVVERTVPASMNNRVQTFDLIYGREFGGRRYSSRWWGGLRYFEYGGQVIAPAWLTSNDTSLGTGFTDQAPLSPLLLEQDTSAFGPTGIWEAHFNFFDKRVVLYLRGQTAFMLSSLSVDSGSFFTLVQVGDPQVTVTPTSRLQEERDKSVWQNTAEVGGRWDLRNGLGVELGYSITGYLDSLLLPNLIIVPETGSQAASGATALYSTQDYEVSGWHFGVSYQF